MPDKPVIKIGCLRIAEHFIAGITFQRLKQKGLVIMNSFEQILDELLKGEIDGALLPMPFAMDLFRKGLEIKLILLVNRGGGRFLKNKHAGIRKIEDFRNKTILTPCFLSVQNMLLHKLFFSAGLKLGKSNDNNAEVLVEVVPSNIIAEVIESDSDNDIGGFVALEPFGVQAVETGNFKEVCKFNSLWKEHPDNVFVVKESAIKKNPEYVKELVNAFIDTCEIIKPSENHGDNDEILSDAEMFLMQEREIVLNLFKDIKGTIRPEMHVPDFTTAEIVQDYIVDQAGFMAAKINMEEFVDASFVIDFMNN